MTMPMDDGPRGVNIPKAELDRRFNDIVAQTDVEDDILAYEPKKRWHSRKDNLLSDHQVGERLKISAIITMAVFCVLTFLVADVTLVLQLAFLSYPVAYWYSIGRHLRPDHPTNESFKGWTVVAMACMALLV